MPLQPIRNLVLGAALAACSALASAAIQQHTFPITGSGGETGMGRFTWDDAVISSGALNENTSSLDAELLSINITISGGSVIGGTTSFTRADCSGAVLQYVPSFTTDINFWCNNGTNSLEGVFFYTNALNGEGSTLTFAPGTTAPVVAMAAQPVPTLSQWGMLMLASLMAMGGFVALRRRS